MFKELFTEVFLDEGKSKSDLGDLQIAWNNYKFNLDNNPKNAERFQKKAYKLWDKIKKYDIDARNASGKLWKDIIDADISSGGRTPKLSKIK